MAEETLQKKKGRKEIGRVPVLSGTPRPKKSTRLYGMGYLNFIFKKNIRVIDDRMRSKQVELPISIFGLDVMEAPQKLKIVP